jgi:hypothetical protein
VYYRVVITKLNGTKTYSTIEQNGSDAMIVYLAIVQHHPTDDKSVQLQESSNAQTWEPIEMTSWTA